MTRLVLASASPRRRQLLEMLGIQVEVRPSAVPEVHRPGEAPLWFEATAIPAGGDRTVFGFPADSLVQAEGALRDFTQTLTKTYGHRTVVKEVTLTFKSGEVVGLLGPNGAGKTTTFYMIVGLLRADAGEITVEGQRI